LQDMRHPCQILTEDAPHRLMDVKSSLMFDADLSRPGFQVAFPLLVKPVRQLNEGLLEQGQWLMRLHPMVDKPSQPLFQGIRLEQAAVMVDLVGVTGHW